MMICNKCGRLIEDIDVPTESEFVGYWGDEKEYQTIQCDCSCGGEYVTAVKCSECGEYFPESETHSFYFPRCKNCLLDYATVENAIKYAAQSGTHTLVHINDFIASIFSEEEINKILEKEIMNKKDWFLPYANNYCLESPEDFSDYLEGEDL